MLNLELKILEEICNGDIDCKISYQFDELVESDTVVEYDGNTIESCSYPDFESLRNHKFILYIRGSDPDLDDNTFRVSYRHRNNLAGLLGFINDSVQSNLCTAAVVDLV